MSVIQVKRALLSVSDKSGLVELASRLSALGVELLSTGGTAKTLREAGLAVVDVSDYTKFPEMMGGRVKTLHPKIHGGLLGRRGIDDTVMAEHDILPIDLVVVNLYPFRETIAQPNVLLSEAVEQIDIGGPSMVRSAAKNHQSVGIVTNPVDYPEVLEAIENQTFDLNLRQKLAYRAFKHTADYDAAIAQYLGQAFGLEQSALPEQLTLNFQRKEILRYGENPHQQAAFYVPQQGQKIGLAGAIKHQGKELSYNNIADADAALQTVVRFHEPACVIVKHANPCGVAIGASVGEAYESAYRCDPTSAFGGIIAFNRALDKETAQEIISRQFAEVILAPSFEPEALLVLQQKANIRVLEVGTAHQEGERQLVSVHGGLLVQDWDHGSISESDLRVVTEREPTADELRDLLFAWRVVRMVKSNAIVFAKDGATVGIGAGQTSRVYSTRIAAIKALDEGLSIEGSALASDAFFPFADGVAAAAAAGAKAIIQPGGSIRDQEVIDEANKHGIAMVFTGMRHFRH
ncbi:MAG: bifunctional phosphoribosylaminoimidazolecarboxamide formyltransferase/IMP cyclohydrolase [Cardiobacteriaceae bacterium]|nr:bifunctional phosphoribosylaminoimidazolecarboxamide formyltransferase/IMP cyclohydrolase [Cardiobacteriaceae bacterium]